jgi:hypothetical protein
MPQAARAAGSAVSMCTGEDLGRRFGGCDRDGGKKLGPCGELHGRTKNKSFRRKQNRLNGGDDGLESATSGAAGPQAAEIFFSHRFSNFIFNSRE